MSLLQELQVEFPCRVLKLDLDVRSNVTVSNSFREASITPSRNDHPLGLKIVINILLHGPVLASQWRGIWLVLQVADDVWRLAVIEIPCNFHCA